MWIATQVYPRGPLPSSPTLLSPPFSPFPSHWLTRALFAYIYLSLLPTFVGHEPTDKLPNDKRLLIDITMRTFGLKEEKALHFCTEKRDQHRHVGGGCKTEPMFVWIHCGYANSLPLFIHLNCTSKEENSYR